MRGTHRPTNKALAEPILTLGAERVLVLLSCCFWVWAFFGVFPHWPAVVVLMAWGLTLFLLRLVAKNDPQGCAIFKKNSRFLLQHRFYSSVSLNEVSDKTRKVQTVLVQRIKV